MLSICAKKVATSATGGQLAWHECWLVRGVFFVGAPSLGKQGYVSKREVRGTD